MYLLIFCDSVGISIFVSIKIRTASFMPHTARYSSVYAPICRARNINTLNSLIQAKLSTEVVPVLKTMPSTPSPKFKPFSGQQLEKIAKYVVEHCRLHVSAAAITWWANVRFAVCFPVQSLSEWDGCQVGVKGLMGNAEVSIIDEPPGKLCYESHFTSYLISLTFQMTC